MQQIPIHYFKFRMSRDVKCISFYNKTYLRFLLLQCFLCWFVRRTNTVKVILLLSSLTGTGRPQVLLHAFL